MSEPSFLQADLRRALVAELIGTAFLLAAVVGSGIMADRLSGGNVGVALLANTVATGAGLVVLILSFADLSGAHFNPAVSLALALAREFPWRRLLPYAVVQTLGGSLGVVVANLMFELPPVVVSTKERAGGAQLLSEIVATFGLVAIIFAVARQRPSAVPYAVGAYITSAYWFTASTSFANPAVTFARTLSDTFAGIRPADAPGFVLAQLVGAALATAVFAWLLPRPGLPRRVS